MLVKSHVQKIMNEGLEGVDIYLPWSRLTFILKNCEYFYNSLVLKLKLKYLSTYSEIGALSKF